MLSPAAQRTLAAEELAAARVSGDAAALARAEERWEALQESVIGFDPRLHPRNRAGQFRHSLMNLGKGGISEVDLPNGMTVKKAVGGGYRLTDRSGHKLGRHMSVDKVMRRIEKEGVNLYSERPREVSMTERVKVFAPERVTALASSGIDAPKVQPREALIAHLGSKGVSFPDETVSRILPYDNRYLWQDFKPGPTRIKYGHVVSMRGTGTLNFPDHGRTMEVDVTYHSPIGKPGNPGKTLTTVTQKKTGTPIEDVLRSEGISPDPTPVGGSASYAEHLASLSTSSLVSNWDTNYTNMKAGVVDRDGGAQRQIDMAQIELEMRKRGISVELWRAETPQGRQDRINRYFHKEQREQGEAEGAALVMDSPVVVDGLSERRPGRVVKTNKDSVDVEVTREDGTTYVSRFRRETIRKGVFSSAVSISIPASRRNTLRSEGIDIMGKDWESDWPTKPNGDLILKSLGGGVHLHEPTGYKLQVTYLDPKTNRTPEGYEWVAPDGQKHGSMRSMRSSANGRSKGAAHTVALQIAMRKLAPPPEPEPTGPQVVWEQGDWRVEQKPGGGVSLFHSYGEGASRRSGYQGGFMTVEQAKNYLRREKGVSV